MNLTFSMIIIYESYLFYDNHIWTSSALSLPIRSSNPLDILTLSWSRHNTMSNPHPGLGEGSARSVWIQSIPTRFFSVEGDDGSGTHDASRYSGSQPASWRRCPAAVGWGYGEAPDRSDFNPKLSQLNPDFNPNYPRQLWRHTWLTVLNRTSHTPLTTKVCVHSKLHIHLIS